MSSSNKPTTANGLSLYLIRGSFTALFFFMFSLSLFMCIIAGQFIYMWNEFGWMPSESTAISLKDDALKFAQVASEESAWTEMEKLPESIQQHHPKSVDIEDGCVLILFSVDISNDYGYAYCPQGVLPPDDWMKNCKKVAEGVYLYEYEG